MEMLALVAYIFLADKYPIYKENNNLFTQILKSIVILLTVCVMILPFIVYYGG